MLMCHSDWSCLSVSASAPTASLTPLRRGRSSPAARGQFPNPSPAHCARDRYVQCAGCCTWYHEVLQQRSKQNTRRLTAGLPNRTTGVHAWNGLCVRTRLQQRRACKTRPATQPRGCAASGLMSTIAYAHRQAVRLSMRWCSVVRSKLSCNTA